MGQLYDEVAGLTADTVIENEITESGYPKHGHDPDDSDRDHQFDQREARSIDTKSGTKTVIRWPDIHFPQTGVAYSVS